MKKSGRSTARGQSPVNADSYRELSRTQNGFGYSTNLGKTHQSRSGNQSRIRNKSTTEQSLDLSQVSNPLLKSSVTAEDLAARLMSHKIKAENKIRMKRQQMEDELLAQGRPQTNTHKNEQMVSDRAPI